MRCANMEELNANCLGCMRCELGKTRTNLVFGVGNDRAEVMLIGEGPGEQEDLQELAARLNGEFNEEQARINDEARDSIQAFLKVFNRTHKYDYVMVKAGENLLIANPKFDITKDVVKGLNKRYKIRPEVAEKIKKVEAEKDKAAKK